MTIPISQGYTLWEGPSRFRNVPVVVVATGFMRQTSNVKTGPMVQTWLLTRNTPPQMAVQTGEDEAVCNKCPLRQYTVRQEAIALGTPAGQKPTQCYVTTHYGPRAIWWAYHRGKYPKIAREDWPELFAGLRVRLGSYGNFSNVPAVVTKTIARASDGWTLYEHNWEKRSTQPMKRYAMASCSSLEEKTKANSMGWRTFRVKQAWEPALPDEVVCPASEEGGKKAACYQCRLCQGTSKRAKNIVIDDHGPTSRALTQKRMAGRGLFSLPVLGQ